MHKNRKKYLRSAAIGLTLANGCWASLTQNGNGGTDWSPAVLAMVSVWACYLSVTWLFGGMRSK